MMCETRAMLDLKDVQRIGVLLLRFLSATIGSTSSFRQAMIRGDSNLRIENFMDSGTSSTKHNLVNHSED